jgi:hypothetical protein
VNILRVVLAFGSLICGCANVAAGEVVLQTDISVTLAAEPSVNLQSGQRIMFTISATNHGPEPVNGLPIRSSPIYDELDVFSGSAECDNNIVLAVVDLEDTFYFTFTWFAGLPESPLAVGETRICYLSLDFTPWAPPVFPFTFAMSVVDDLNPSNNSATVYLRRPLAVDAVPMSPAWLSLLAALLTLVATMRQTRSRSIRSRLLSNP